MIARADNDTLAAMMRALVFVGDDAPVSAAAVPVAALPELTGIEVLALPLLVLVLPELLTSVLEMMMDVDMLADPVDNAVLLLMLAQVLLRRSGRVEAVGYGSASAKRRRSPCGRTHAGSDRPQSRGEQAQQACCAACSPVLVLLVSVESSPS